MGRGGLRHEIAVSSARHRSDPQSRDDRGIVCIEGSLQMVMHFRRYPWGEAMRRSDKILR